MHDSSNIRLLLSAIREILTPLVRMMLKSGISYQTFSQLTKNIFIEVAETDFKLAKRKQTISRISTITGLTRKEVGSRVKSTQEDLDRIEEQYNWAIRVISAWKKEPAFQSHHGDPPILPLSGEDRSFETLVKKSSGDIPVRAILDELIRSGIVEIEADGRLRLVNPAYIPKNNNGMQFQILGKDVKLLIETIESNMNANSDPERLLQRKVSYDNLPEEILPHIRSIAKIKGMELLSDLDAVLAAHDRDGHPQMKGAGRFLAGVGVYYFEKNVEGKEPKNETPSS